MENALAASFSMSSSKTSVSAGESFTISVGGDCIGRVDLQISGGTLSTSSIWVEMGMQTINVTAGQSGNIVITAIPAAGFSDADAEEYNPGARSVTIGIASNNGGGNNQTKPDTPSTSKPTTPTVTDKRSSNNNLVSLKVDKGALAPDFNKNVTEYNLNLPKDVTEINIEAKAEDAKAKLSGAGKISLKPGENTVTISVTAENTSKKNYILHIYLEEEPEIYLNFQEQKIGIVKNLSKVETPEGFTKEDIVIDGKETTLFVNEKISLIYGVDEKLVSSFYLYDKENNKVLGKVTFLAINGKTYYAVDSKKENGEKVKVSINDTEIEAYKFLESENYYLISIIDSNGDIKDYLYEKTEQTMQLYPEFLNNSCPEKENNIVIISILSLLVIALLGTTSYLLIRIKRGK